MLVRVPVGSTLHTDLSSDPCLRNITALRLDDRPLGEGGQGRVSRVLEIDGRRPTQDYVFKEFIAGTPATFHEIFGALKTAAGPNRIAEVPSLACLPLTLLSGAGSGRAIEGYLMRSAPGISFSELLETRLNEYVNYPIEKRLKLAYQFVEGVAKLHETTIILADLNGQNLFVDVTRSQVSLIDIDGGAVARNRSAPAVFGKLDPAWLAPELLQELLGKPIPTVNVQLTADLYALAAGVHLFILGLSPFFFLQRMVDLPKYLAHCSWATFKTAPGVALRNCQAFDYHRRTLAQVPRLQKLFQVAFQRGYFQPSQRLTAYVWLQALKSELARRKKPATVGSRGSLASVRQISDSEVRTSTSSAEARNKERPSMKLPSTPTRITARRWPFLDGSTELLAALRGHTVGSSRNVRAAFLVAVLLVAILWVGRSYLSFQPESVGVLTVNRSAYLNVRDRPTLVAKVKSVVKVATGDQLSLIESKGRWSCVRVNFGKNAAVGWVYDAGEAFIPRGRSLPDFR